jgi:hypothetical protein
VGPDRQTTSYQRKHAERQRSQTATAHIAWETRRVLM